VISESRGHRGSDFGISAVAQSCVDWRFYWQCVHGVMQHVTSCKRCDDSTGGEVDGLAAVLREKFGGFRGKFAGLRMKSVSETILRLLC
jgi:hypothetical protein